VIEIVISVTYTLTWNTPKTAIDIFRTDRVKGKVGVGHWTPYEGLKTNDQAVIAMCGELVGHCLDMWSERKGT
jgi:hypothetical protein